MSTPVATVADALISFILSLLRDPAAVEEFDAAPKEVLASKGLQGVCAADVEAVKPVIVDNPTVVVKTVAPPPPAPHHHQPDEVTREIHRIINQFTTVDARTTIVDQSTNQNIWTNGGDVTQYFDQEAVVASGDEAIAVGDDANFVDSEVDVTVGDVSVGNTTNEGSYNNTDDEETTEVTETVVTETVVVPADADPAADPAAIAGAAVDAAVDASLDAASDAQAVVQEATAPAEDPLAADLTASDPYDSGDAGAAIVEDAYVEEPTEEQ